MLEQILWVAESRLRVYVDKEREEGGRLSWRRDLSCTAIGGTSGTHHPRDMHLAGSRRRLLPILLGHLQRSLVCRLFEDNFADEPSVARADGCIVVSPGDGTGAFSHASRRLRSPVGGWLGDNSDPVLHPAVSKRAREENDRWRVPADERAPLIRRPSSIGPLSLAWADLAVGRGAASAPCYRDRNGSPRPRRPPASRAELPPRPGRPRARRAASPC